MSTAPAQTETPSAQSSLLRKNWMFVAGLAVAGAAVLSQVPRLADGSNSSSNLQRSGASQYVAAQKLSEMSAGLSFPSITNTPEAKALVSQAEEICRSGPASGQEACLTRAADSLFKESAKNLYYSSLPDNRAYIAAAIGGLFGGTVGALGLGTFAATSRREKRVDSAKTPAVKAPTSGAAL